MDSANASPPPADRGRAADAAVPPGRAGRQGLPTGGGRPPRARGWRRPRAATPTSSCSTWACPTATDWTCRASFAAGPRCRSSCSRRAGREQDKVAALDLGADDYLTKPFGVGRAAGPDPRGATPRRAPPGERAGAGVRGGRPAGGSRRREVRRGGQEVHLDADRVQAAHDADPARGEGAHPSAAAERGLGRRLPGQSHYVRVYMAQLRQKLEADPARPRLLITEPGVGYRFRAE